MHLHGAGLDQRLEQVPLDDLHGQHHAEHPQGDHEAAVGERDQDGDRAGEEGPEVGDVGADEDQRAEPDGTGDAEHEQPHGDEDGVDEGDQRRPVHEALDGPERPARHGLQERAGVRGRQRVQGAHRPVGVAQEEEEQQQGEHRRGDRLADHADPAEQPGGGRTAELPAELAGAGGQIVQRGPLGAEVPGDRLGGVPQRVDDLAAGVDQRGDHDVHGPADHREHGEHRQPRGQRLVEPPPHQPPVQRPEQRGPEQREQHRHHGRPEEHRKPDDDHRDRGHQQDQQTPGPDTPRRLGQQRPSGSPPRPRPGSLSLCHTASSARRLPGRGQAGPEGVRAAGERGGHAVAPCSTSRVRWIP
ncbi:hypothetical protein SLNWT_3535 [Streptomyces albus]|uniref:Uncharacterized protein n=1 Tax=Streptomyces albus (strain ATCC 21838 / DSM 41398 / FERM P-419 / JCM 4703 / NBRC 107858) TaxID=1081613 RepID=A0A0B5EZ62_STRA4|nr:hypothetical protein SLNWT_3535 [Streptomyces albus]AOU78215.1 hypothetical protein SLNHY_3524 [Streptomyces albus]AYN33968.1 hypothetical protein DUI70_3467 [Streptomyces albus]